jgi:hypothetical protein
LRGATSNRTQDTESKTDLALLPDRFLHNYAVASPTYLPKEKEKKGKKEEKEKGGILSFLWPLILVTRPP